jgi:hypothetical protein
MSSEREVLDQFAARGLRHGEELYLPPGDTRDFIHACETKDLAVVGIEGFVRSGDQLTPLLDCIADFSSLRADSWLGFRAGCNRAAADFVSRTPNRTDLMLNFTTISRESWDPAGRAG